MLTFTGQRHPERVWNSVLRFSHRRRLTVMSCVLFCLGDINVAIHDAGASIFTRDLKRR